MTEYKWIINQMDCLSKDGDLTDFVVKIYWNRNATKIVNDKEYTASISGNQSFSKDDVTNFIPYENLTYNIVCGWLDNLFYVSELDANLDAKIENIINPPIISLPLPWVK
jgi:hypothetical protein